MYEIRLCGTSEIKLLTTFLNDSWSQNHIFVTDIDILDFQHKSDAGYNFVVAYHVETNSFHGVLGIISPEFYVSRRIEKNQDVWLAIWKVDKSLAKVSSLGMDMLSYVETKFKPKSISAIGINKTVEFFYKAMGFKTQKMNQWFIPNKKINDYRLVIGELPAPINSPENPYLKVIECNPANKPMLEEFLTKSKAKHSFNYLVSRYLNHPTYNYVTYAFINSNLQVICVAIGREVFANGAKAFRITDLIFKNDIPVNLSYGLDEIMSCNSYEYLDFMEYGYDSLSLANSGFIQCSDDLFVPHLFEPFVAEHRQVKIAYRSKLPFSCTKGDSDLDRPS